MLSIWLPVAISASVWSPVTAADLTKEPTQYFRQYSSYSLFEKNEKKQALPEVCGVRSKTGEYAYSLSCAGSVK